MDRRPAQGAVAGVAARSENAVAIGRIGGLGPRSAEAAAAVVGCVYRLRRSWAWLGVGGDGGLVEEWRRRRRRRRERGGRGGRGEGRREEARRDGLWTRSIDYREVE